MRSLFARLLRRRALVLAALLAIVGRALYPAPPPRTLEGLAEMLGGAASGTVLTSDIAWEPSPGVLAELLWGRRVLFLARSSGGARDLYRASVRVTLEGRPVSVSGVHNLTATPLGDEQKLVGSERRVAFATASYGKIESITVLDLAGSTSPVGASIVDGATAAITNWRETGTMAGLGRLDVTFDDPDDAASLAFEGDLLLIGRGKGRPGSVLDLATGLLVANAGALGAHVSLTPALRKRPILWAVDTVRAEVGPEPVAVVEAAVFNVRDVARRSIYAVFGTTVEAPEVPHEVPQAASPPRPLDASYLQTDSSVWPPAAIAPTWKNAAPGEGVWEPVTLPWLKHFPSAEVSERPAADAAAGGVSAPPPYFYTTMVRPDPDRPYAKVLVVAMDMRQLELDMEAGVEDPKPLTGTRGSGKIPRDPKVLSRVVAAFNGAFKTTHGEYGMMVHRRVLLPPKPKAATVVVSEDRRVGLGTWGSAVAIPKDVVSFRQNLEPLIEDGKLSPSGRTQWGWQLEGTSMMTERSGLCVSASGQLYYLWGDEVSAPTLGKAMILAGCTYGMHLDMNPHHTGFVFANVRSVASKDYEAKLLTQQMEIAPERYLEYSPKDFFYLMLRDPTPPGDIAWKEDVGTQPAPAWLPTVWHAMVQSVAGIAESPVQVELSAFDAGRVLWRVRPAKQEGQHREYQSSELGSDDQHRVIAAIGLGNPHEGRDNSNAKSAFGKLPIGGLVADEKSGLSLLSEAESLANLDEDDVIQLPLILDLGKVSPAAKESRSMRRRGAACVTPGNLTVLAMATTDSDEAAALALQRVGCVRAVSLDRGSHRPTFLHRPGGGSPPLARYDESVLYAISRPMAPRAYRWSP